MLRTLLLVCFLVLSGQCQEYVYDSDIEEYPGLVDDYTEYNYQDYQNYDVDYSHQAEFPPIDLSNATVKKCQCQGNEVLVDGVCKEHTTFMAVLLTYSWVQVPANTSDFGHVKVGKLQCPPNHVEVKRNTHEFSVTEHGHLIDMGLQFIYVDYCIEHLLDEKGELTWEAYGCLKPPKLHMCCSDTEILNSTNDCVPNDGKNSPPPLYMEEDPKQFSSLEASDVGMLSCGADEGQLTKVVLNGKKGMLLYHPETPFLMWAPSSSLQESNNYCVAKEDTNGDGDLHDVAFVCYVNPLEQHQQKCSNATCIRKCCPRGKIFDYSLGGCALAVNETQLWVPNYHTMEIDGPKTGASAPEDLAIVEGMPICSTDMFALEPHKNKEDKFHLLKNGSMHVPLYKTSLDSIHYCMDNFNIDNTQIVTLALMCFAEDGESHTTRCPIIHNILHPIFLLISAIFLAIVMIVYISIPELHAKVHGKCLVSHSFSLLLAFVFLVIVKWANKDMNIIACKTMASVIHISFLSAFFWLNVMCFDIWWTLKSMRPVAESGDASRRRFRIYSLYAWGCPAIIGMVAIIMNELPEEYDVLRPGFGEINCWFKGTTELWTYFYGFVLLLVIFNIIFFCHVSYILITMQRRNDPILNRTKKQERERVWLYVKLFSVMGITWVAEIISWQDGSCWGWFFTDAINSLQGLFIFLIFICKANMLKKIRDQWSPYIRTFKKAVGSTRITRSTTFTNTKRSDLSASQSEQANNDSKASQRTTESVLESSGKNLTPQNSVTGSVTGAQIHLPLSVKERPISEVSSEDLEAAIVSDKHKTNVSDNKDNP
ncbi:unnamed protein product [Meganyctiphanes norvegica]|uniref:G-protein coupled receptors family 2 profile 2 domain-containing protein n=1 Tax=Meganyctiphanes norvegica TaxID=48144 RepID=A0AAV2QT69_MEGNR